MQQKSVKKIVNNSLVVDLIQIELIFNLIKMFNLL